MKKECYLVGFGTYIDKETGEKMLRIIISIDSKKDNYFGKLVAPPIYIEYNEELEKKLLNHLKNRKDYKVYYTTEENIITGKVKINSIYIERNEENEKF